MKPYARRDAKLRLNNRKKFNAGSRRISRESSPPGWPGNIVPLSLMLVRFRKARQQGLTRDEFDKYGDAML
jgi:hypothetical protein